MKDNPSIIEVTDIKVLSSNPDYDSINFKFFITTTELIGTTLPIEELPSEELTITP